jgi:hypothetical protein
MPVRIEIKIARGSSSDEQQKNFERALKLFKNKSFKLGISSKKIGKRKSN